MHAHTATLHNPIPAYVPPPSPTHTLKHMGTHSFVDARLVAACSRQKESEQTTTLHLTTAQHGYTKQHHSPKVQHGVLDSEHQLGVGRHRVSHLGVEGGVGVEVLGGRVPRAEQHSEVALHAQLLPQEQQQLWAVWRMQRGTQQAQFDTSNTPPVDGEAFPRPHLPSVPMPTAPLTHCATSPALADTPQPPSPSLHAQATRRKW